MVPDPTWRQVVLTRSKLQSAHSRNKKRHFSEKLYFPIQFQKKESNQENPSKPSTHWFSFNSHGGSTQSDCKQAFGFCSCYVLFLQRLQKDPCHVVDPSTWCKDRASSMFLLYNLANLYLSLIHLQLKLQNSLKNLEAIRAWQVSLLQSILGSSWQGFIGLKHLLLFHVIIYWNNLQNILPLTSPYSLSTSNFWVPALYLSIGNAVPLSSRQNFFRVNTSKGCVSEIILHNIICTVKNWKLIA